MVVNVRSFFCTGLHRRLAEVILTSLLILSSLPRLGFGSISGNPLTRNSINELLSEAENFHSTDLTNKLTEVERSISSSQDPLSASREFLESFVSNVNSRYGLSLSLNEACKLVRENLHRLEISSKDQIPLLIAMDLLETGRSVVLFSGHEQPDFQDYEAFKLGKYLYWPWDWNWFGLNKSTYRHKHRHNYFTKNIEVELPGNCYFGACEAFAGALLCLIPNPLAWRCGVGMILDGGRRVVDGIIELSDERRLNPDFQQPKPPF